jgi:hypothetical protein
MQRFAIWVVCLFAICVGLACADYSVTETHSTSSGISASLKLIPGTGGPYGSDIQNLNLDVSYYNTNTVRVRFSDAASKRWEVPDVIKVDPVSKVPAQPQVLVDITSEGVFNFAVRAAVDNNVIFNSTASFSGALPFVVCFQGRV